MARRGAHFIFSAPATGSPKKTPFSFDVPATLTAINPAKCGGLFNKSIAPFEGTCRRGGGFRFSACRRLSRRLRGKELCGWSFGVYRPRWPVRVHPLRAGMERIPPTACVVGSSETPVVCVTQAWGRRSPGAASHFDSARSWRTPNASRIRRGRARSRQRMECGGVPPAV